MHIQLVISSGVSLDSIAQLHIGQRRLLHRNDGAMQSTAGGTDERASVR